MKLSSMVLIKRFRSAALLVISIAMTAAPVSHADEDAERENLTRISYELSQLQRMINDAAKEAETSGGVRFRYDLLARDLRLVRAGVDDHLQRPRQPQRVQPLAGDYRN